MKKGYYRLVTGKETRPEAAGATPTAAEVALIDAWEDKALRAAGEIYLAVDQEQKTHLAGIEDDPVAMWSKLESVHLQKRPGARFNA